LLCRFIRNQCQKEERNSLACLLHCVEWNNHKEVAEMYRLLDIWPTLPVERSLQLLDSAYADQCVRTFAVKGLRTIGCVLQP
jgi:hypothetical protein